MTEIFFAKPENLHDAKQQLTGVEADITDIGMQLSVPREERDQVWESRARGALRLKKREQAFLKNCIRDFIQESKEVREHAEQRGSMNLIAHLRAQSKLMGGLHQLLLAVEQHLIHETDETWEQMRISAETVRSIKYLQ